MASIADLIKGLKKLDDQSFRPGDSLAASTINHPLDALSQLGKYLAKQTNTAAGIPDQYDNPNPLLAPSPDAQSQAAFDLAGMAQVGSMPFAPKSSGGTVGTLAKPAMAADGNLNEELIAKYLREGQLSPQELAQYETNAVQMTDSGKHHFNLANANAQGGTPESRAVDLGFDTPVYHGTGSGDLIGNELVPGGANGAKQTGDAYGMGVYTSTAPNTANAYTSGESPAVFPLMVNRQNYLNIDYPTQKDYEKLSKYAGEVMLPSDKARFEGGKAIKEFEDLQSARDFFAERRKDWEQFGGGYDRARPEAILGDDGIPKVQYTDFFGDVPITNPDDAFTLMRATGWDNIPSMGYEGHTMLRNKSEDWDITRNTKNLRSRFAAFDPLRKDSANLLATRLLPATMLGYGMYNEKKKRSLADLLGAQ